MARTPTRRAGRSLWLALLLALELTALVAAGAVTTYELRHLDRIYEGVEAAGIPLGGMRLDEATSAIADSLTPFPGDPIMLRFGDRLWQIVPADLGIMVDANQMASAAYTIGRETDSLRSSMRGMIADLAVQMDALAFGRSVPISTQVRSSRLEDILQRAAAEVDRPPVEGRLSIMGLEITGSPGEPGREVDLVATRNAVMELFHSKGSGVVDLVVRPRLPSVTSVGPAVEQAEALLGEPLLIELHGMDGVTRLAADRAMLSRWLVLTPVRGSNGVIELDAQLDRPQVSAFLEEIAADLKRIPEDAELDFDPIGKEVLVLRPGHAGEELDVDAATDSIEAALVGPEPGRAISISTTILKPLIDSDNLDELGIVEQVSEGTTYFAGSSRERVLNIEAAASKFDHIVVPPDHEFSFNEHVGEITTANGFVEGLIIGAERTAVGIGGGVCQVSTTAFRAAFQGGFPITERWAHGYIVSWYGEPGLDATIFTPNVDFRFRNDTEHFLLVKSEVDAAKGRITFYIYGTRPDRTVEWTKPAISDTRPAPKPLYQLDSTLPSGTLKQVDWAKDGMTVVVNREIRLGDGKVVTETFESEYQPWQAIYLYGPGTELPAGAVTEAPAGQ